MAAPEVLKINKKSRKVPLNLKITKTAFVNLLKGCLVYSLKKNEDFGIIKLTIQGLEGHRICPQSW